MGPAAHSPLVTRVICSRVVCSMVPPSVGYVGPSVVAWPTTVGALVVKAGPQTDWLAFPVSCSGCQPVGRAGS